MERNVTLDYFKLFLCILIINIHCRIESSFNIISFIDNDLFRNGISRIAVPCFFLINGYFLKINDLAKTKKYVSRIGIMYITWSLFYLPMFNVNDLQSILLRIFGGFAHLWYLAALIQGVILFYIVNKVLKNNRSLLFIIAITLFICGYFIQLRYPNPASIDFYKFRNFLFIGTPFLIIGNLLRSINILRYKQSYLKMLIILSIVFITEIVVCYIYNFPVNEIYLSSIILCPLLFTTVLNYSKFDSHKTNLSKLSSAIYVSHLFVKDMALMLFPADVYIIPFVLIMCVLVASTIIYANKTLKIFL